MGRVHLFCALCFCAARVVFLLFRGGVVFAPRVCRRGSFLFGVVALWRRLSLLLLFLLPVPLRSLVWAHVYFRLGRWGRMLGWRCGHLLLLLLLLLLLSLSLSRGLRGWWSSVHARRAAAATTAEPLVLRQADAGVPEQHAWRSRSLVAPATPAATRHWQSRPCALTAMHTDGGPLIVQAVTGIT